MTNPYGYDHQQDRRRWQHTINTAPDTNPIRCWRCHTPIPKHNPAAWQLGHVEDLATGGKTRNRKPECQPCNSAAGGRLRHELTTPPPSRRW